MYRNIYVNIHSISIDTMIEILMIPISFLMLKKTLSIRIFDGHYSFAEVLNYCI